MPTLVLVDHVRFIWPNRRCRIERSSSIIGRASRITDRPVYPTERRDAFNVFDGNVYRFPGQLRRSRSQYIPYVCNGKSVGECTGRGDYTRRARGRSTRGHFTGRIVVRSYPTCPYVDEFPLRVDNNNNIPNGIRSTKTYAEVPSSRFSFAPEISVFTNRVVTLYRRADQFIDPPYGPLSAFSSCADYYDLRYYR